MKNQFDYNNTDFTKIIRKTINQKINGKNIILENLKEENKCIYGDCVNGKGKMVYPEFGTYEGEFKDGKRDGEGTWTYEGDKNITYKGQFKNNEFNGLGTLYYKNGNIKYKGNFVNDNEEGKGVWYWENKKETKMYEGDFMGGFFNGKGVSYDEDGVKVYEGDFKDDEETGYGIFYFKDGSKEVGSFVNGDLVNGKYIHKDGTVYKNVSWQNQDPKKSVEQIRISLETNKQTTKTDGDLKTKDKQFKIKDGSENVQAITYCKTQINQFYETYKTFYFKYKKNIQPKSPSIYKDLPDEISNIPDDMYNNIQEQKVVVNNCVETFSRIFDKDVKEKILRLSNVGDLKDYFQINATIAESKDIYNKPDNMSISNSIKKVLKEQSEIKKSSLVEKQIIENRLNFVLNSKTNKKQKLFNEAKELINKGYDKKIVKETVKSYLK